MRNMPPRTANYVQRAGRAGRRAASAALGGHLRQPYGPRPGEVSGPGFDDRRPDAHPWVPVDNARIARRHAHSIAMAAYFRHRAERDGETWRYAGPFFSPPAPDQESPAASVKHFLDPVPARYDEALRTALPPEVHAELGVHDGSWVDVLVDLLAGAEAEVRFDIDLTTSRSTRLRREREFGLGKASPRRCRPSKVANCWAFWPARTCFPSTGSPSTPSSCAPFTPPSRSDVSFELGRDLGLAIYEYAPGQSGGGRRQGVDIGGASPGARAPTGAA